ncbi:hypothetical protein ACNKHQ_04615 [Shigella flexneri]
MAKSLYQGLFGLDKEMKLQNVPGGKATPFLTIAASWVRFLKLRQGGGFQMAPILTPEAVKVSLNGASNPDSHLKRYNLYKILIKPRLSTPRR